MNNLVLEELKKSFDFQKFLNKRLLIHSRYGNLESVKIYIQEGADVNYEKIEERGITGIEEFEVIKYPLIEAAKQGHAKVVKELLSVGAYINAQDECKRTTLVSATIHGHDEVIKVLKKHGADTAPRDISGCNVNDYT